MNCKALALANALNGWFLPIAHVFIGCVFVVIVTGAYPDPNVV